MSKNEELGLPRDRMKKTVICFDVDGTLISNVDASLYNEKRPTPGIPYTHDVPNPDIINLLKILSRFKNTHIVVWSGGGKDYARMWVDRLGIYKYVDDCDGKIGSEYQSDIAIDDIQDTALGRINLIVREK